MKEKEQSDKQEELFTSLKNLTGHFAILSRDNETALRELKENLVKALPGEDISTISPKMKRLNHEQLST